MRLIAWKTLRSFYESPAHRAAEQPLRTWKAIVQAANWSKPTDVKASFPQADILKGSRAVFDIGGNKWRIVASIGYESSIVFVKFVGTHAQYEWSMPIGSRKSKMDAKIIRSEAEHDAVLAEIGSLIGRVSPLTGSERERLDLLALLSEAYEDEHHPIGLPAPIAAIRSRMQDLHLRPADMATAMGGRNRVSEVLNGVRPLTLPMIRRLSAQLGLPVAVLVQDYPLAERSRSRAA